MEDQAKWLKDNDVYRDKDGNPVTLSHEQVAAVQRAFFVWQRVHHKEKGSYPDMNNPANWIKSCLLGRMLIDGKPPLPEAPPVVMSAPAYHLVDPDLCPKCGGDKDKPGKNLGVSIDQDSIPASFKKMYKSMQGEEIGKVRMEFKCIDACHFEGKEQNSILTVP